MVNRTSAVLGFLAAAWPAAVQREERRRRCLAVPGTPIAQPETEWSGAGEPASTDDAVVSRYVRQAPEGPRPVRSRPPPGALHEGAGLALHEGAGRSLPPLAQGAVAEAPHHGTELRPDAVTAPVLQPAPSPAGGAAASESAAQAPVAPVLLAPESAAPALPAPVLAAPNQILMRGVAPSATADIPSPRLSAPRLLEPVGQPAPPPPDPERHGSLVSAAPDQSIVAPASQHGPAASLPPIQAAAAASLPPVHTAATLPPIQAAAAAGFPPIHTAAPAAILPPFQGAAAATLPSVHTAAPAATLPPIQGAAAATLSSVHTASPAATLPPIQAAEPATLPPGRTAAAAATLSPAPAAAAARLTARTADRFARRQTLLAATPSLAGSWLAATPVAPVIPDESHALHAPQEPWPQPVPGRTAMLDSPPRGRPGPGRPAPIGAIPGVPADDPEWDVPGAARSPLATPPWDQGRHNAPGHGIAALAEASDGEPAGPPGYRLVDEAELRRMLARIIQTDALRHGLDLKER